MSINNKNFINIDTEKLYSDSYSNSEYNINSYSKSQYQYKYTHDNDIYNNLSVSDNKSIDKLIHKHTHDSCIPKSIEEIDFWKRKRNIDQYDFFPIKNPSFFIVSSESLLTFSDSLKKELNCFKIIRMLFVKINIKIKKLSSFLTENMVINAINQINTGRFYVSQYYENKKKLELLIKNKQSFCAMEYYENLLCSQNLLKVLIKDLVNESLPISRKFITKSKRIRWRNKKYAINL
jgi:hypothetical protein